MPHTVLHLQKTYKNNAVLLNEMAAAGAGRYRTLTAYLSGKPDGRNRMESVTSETLYLDLDRKNLNWTRPNTIKSVARLIDEKEVDLVVCQFRRVMPIGVLAAKLSRRKPRVVGVMHGVVGGRVGFGRKIINWFIYRGMERLVSVSEGGVEDILRLNWGLDRRKVVAVQNGLDFTAIVNAERKPKAAVLGEQCEGKFLFGVVGRLTEGKNHEHLVRAFKQVHDNDRQAVLVIVGKGRLEARLKSLVEELALHEAVMFAGFRNDVPEVLKALDVYVMPSRREGLPLALLEAMAAGLPVITSARSGMAEVVSGQLCGELVDPLSIDAIAAAMAAMLARTPEELAVMGAASRKRALEQFSSERMKADYERLYGEVLGIRQKWPGFKNGRYRK